MNKIEEKHLDIIEQADQYGYLLESTKKQHATSCAEITKEYAFKFVNWIKNKPEIRNEFYNDHITDELLWKMFLNDLKVME